MCWRLTLKWPSLFPVEQKTREQSLLFVKKLVAVGISSVTYLRSLFPEIAYGDKDLDGLKLKMLLDTSSCHISNVLVSWMKGCFQAMENQYLRQMTFAIHEDSENLNSALEAYAFKFRYTPDGMTEVTGFGASSNSFDEQAYDVRKSTVKMLRTVLLLTQALKPLPRRVYLSMKLGYYDEVTPPDYEPPGFKEGGHSCFWFSEKPITIRAGDISTRFHTVKVRVSVDRKTYSTDENSPNSSKEVEDNGYPQEAVMNNEEQKEEPYNSTEFPTRSFVSHSPILMSPPLMSSPGLNNAVTFDVAEDPASPTLDPTPSNTSQDKPSDMRDRVSSQEDQLVPDIPTQEQTCTPDSFQSVSPLSRAPPTEFESVSSCKTEMVTNTNSANVMMYPVRCPCGANIDDGVMILCVICNWWQHALCFNVVESNTPERHVCEMCATPANPCSDPSLMTEPKVSTLCLYRRTLVYLHDSHKGGLTAAHLAQRLGVDITSGRAVIQHLLDNKLIKRIKKKNSYSITRGKLVQHILSRSRNSDSHQQDTHQQDTMRSSQTPHCSVSDAGCEGDTTPDLEIGSLRKSMRSSTSKNSEVLEPHTPDETMDITTDTRDIMEVAVNEGNHSQGVTLSTQDVTVGTQAQLVIIPSGLEGVERKEEEESSVVTSPPHMSAENTLDIVDSATPCLSTQDLVLQDLETEEIEQTDFGNTTHKKARRQRTLLTTSVSLAGRKRTLASSTNMSLNDFEISMSQESLSQEKKSRTSEVISSVEIFPL